MRILITGSRTWTDRQRIEEAIIEQCNGQQEWNITIVVGDADGADKIARQFGNDSGWRVEEHKANWDKYGKGAGPIRNQEMVDSGAYVGLAFFDGPSDGTYDCMTRAREAQIPVIEYWSQA